MFTNLSKLKLFIAALLMLIGLQPALAIAKGGGTGSSRSVAKGDTMVNGYIRSDGTYVAPHMRSAPDGNFYNNWTTYGNVNPYTGTAGAKIDIPPIGYSSLRISPIPSGVDMLKTLDGSENQTGSSAFIWGSYAPNAIVNTMLSESLGVSSQLNQAMSSGTGKQSTSVRPKIPVAQSIGMSAPSPAVPMTGPGSGKIYAFTDEYGITHFTNLPHLDKRYQLVYRIPN